MYALVSLSLVFPARRQIAPRQELCYDKLRRRLQEVDVEASGKETLPRGITPPLLHIVFEV